MREQDDFGLRGKTMKRIWIDSFDTNVKFVLRNRRIRNSNWEPCSLRFARRPKPSSRRKFRA